MEIFISYDPRKRRKIISFAHKINGKYSCFEIELDDCFSLESHPLTTLSDEKTQELISFLQIGLEEGKENEGL